jgi:hypothetical protein
MTAIGIEMHPRAGNFKIALRDLIGLDKTYMQLEVMTVATRISTPTPIKLLIIPPLTLAAVGIITATAQLISNILELEAVVRYRHGNADLYGMSGTKQNAPLVTPAGLGACRVAAN